MPLNRKKTLKSFKTLRKALKLPVQTPEEVHQLRTGTRKIEALVRGLGLDRRRAGKRLLQQIKPLRRQAGSVRDLDVFTGLALELARSHVKPQQAGLLTLIEHLGAQRMKAAEELTAFLDDKKAGHTEHLRHSLKRCARQVRNGFDEAPKQAVGSGLELAGKLAAWPPLDPANLHEFRIRAKELRYLLQFAETESPLLQALGPLKDSIGTWHDWSELARIAGEVLDREKAAGLLQQIEATAAAKFKDALRLANQARRQFLAQSTQEPAGPVKAVEAVEKLAG